MLEFDRKDAKAWALKKLTGFYQCPISPVTADGKMDEAGLRENIEKFIDIGIDGLVVGSPLRAAPAIGAAVAAYTAAFGKK